MKVTKETMSVFLIEMFNQIKEEHGFDFNNGTSQLSGKSKKCKMAYAKGRFIESLINYCHEGLPSGTRFSKKSFLEFIDQHKTKCENALVMINNGNKGLIATPLELNAVIDACIELKQTLKT